MSDNEDEQNFEDEPLGGSDVDQAGGDSGQKAAFEFEGVDDAMAKAERRRERRRRRNERTGKIAACCICVCLIIGGIVALVLVKKAEKIYHDAFVYETEAPSAAPTGTPTIFTSPAPSAVAKPTFSVKTPPPTATSTASPTIAPTVSPTISPAPTKGLADSYQLAPKEDTYVFIDGPENGRIFGRENTLLVQHGSRASTKPGQVPEIPTAFGILKFVLNDDPDFPQRDRWTPNMGVTLQLSQVVNADEDDVVNIDVYRMPNNYDFIYESMTGVDYTTISKSSTDGVHVTRQTILGTDKDVELDVRSALFLSDDRMSSGLYKDDQVVLRLEINDSSPREGNTFRSRESNQPPLLVFNFGA